MPPRPSSQPPGGLAMLGGIQKEQESFQGTIASEARLEGEGEESEASIDAAKGREQV